MSENLVRRISIVSDEAGASFGDAVRVCDPLGIKRYELRLLNGRRVPEVAEADIEEVIRLTSEHGLVLTGLSPGYCKHEFDGEESKLELERGFGDAFRLMERLEISRFTLFTYMRNDADGEIPEQALEQLGQSVGEIRRAGYEVLLENVPNAWGNTGARLGRIAGELGLHVTWDPANAAQAGEQAWPDGYRAVRGRVKNLHLKNWREGEGNVYLQEGVVYLAGQLSELVKDGYEGDFCIENHRWDDPQATARNHSQLVGMLRRLSGAG